MGAARSSQRQAIQADPLPPGVMRGWSPGGPGRGATGIAAILEAWSPTRPAVSTLTWGAAWHATGMIRTPTVGTALNKLYYGDNLKVLREHVANEGIDLIYLDPPFNSDREHYSKPHVIEKKKSPLAASNASR